MPSPNAAVASRRAPSNAAAKLGLARDEAHALAAAAGGRLDQHREADLLRAPRAPRSAVGKPSPSGPLSPGTTGVPAAVTVLRASVLLPILRIASADGPMKVMPGGGAGVGEVLVLRQEAVAGVDRVGAGLPAGVEDLVDHQVALRGRRRADRDRARRPAGRAARADRRRCRPRRSRCRAPYTYA